MKTRMIRRLSKGAGVRDELFGCDLAISSRQSMPIWLVQSIGTAICGKTRDVSYYFYVV